MSASNYDIDTRLRLIPFLFTHCLRSSLTFLPFIGSRLGITNLLSTGYWYQYQGHHKLLVSGIGHKSSCSSVIPQVQGLGSATRWLLIIGTMFSVNIRHWYQARFIIMLFNSTSFSPGLYSSPSSPSFLGASFNVINFQFTWNQVKHHHQILVSSKARNHHVCQSFTPCLV